MDEAYKKLAKIKEANEAKAITKVLQLSNPFGENTRAVSNPMVRCALFAAVHQRNHFPDYTQTGKIKGMKIEYKGTQLNQDDHDTLMQLVKMAVDQPIGSNISVSVNAVLKGLGRQTHLAQRQQLYQEIDRLMSGTVRISPEGMVSYHGHILDDASMPLDQTAIKPSDRKITYRLNPKFASLYSNDTYTLIDFSKRQALKGRGSELAKWLHLFIESHAEQYRYKVETLQIRSGSTVKELKKFRYQLKRALDLLKNSVIINDWSIDPKNDLVTIERTPTTIQQKHLIKRIYEHYDL